MMEGGYLHQNGFTGAGKLIAVLDGGFHQTDVVPFLDSLRLEGRLAAQYDFVDLDTLVYESTAPWHQSLVYHGL